MKRKISVTTGSRSEYGILRPLLRIISQSKNLELYLIVTDMHLSKKHGMTINEIKKDGFKIFSTIYIPREDDSLYSMSKSLGREIIEFSKIFQKLQPDINLILGDRDEMLASAIAAYHMNIPNAHVHGGDKTKGGIDEYNRHAITKMSNIHFAATKKSMQRILQMGENPKYVLLSGSPSVDEIRSNSITNEKDLEKKYRLNFTGEEILLIQHPVTTQVKEVEKQIINTLHAIVKLKKTTIAIAPNSDPGNMKIFKQLEKFSKKYDFIHVYKNFPRSDYLGLLQNCGVLVGNSSSGIIEAGYFDIPVVNIGIRQEDREKGNNVINIKDFYTRSIYNAILQSLRRKKQGKIKRDNIYGDGLASKRIVHFLERVSIDNKLIQKQIFY